MEENNRKGPGVFYAVVGVATLVVAIIGATFAYFSASTGTQGEDKIGGTTASGASLTLTVTKVSDGATGLLVPMYDKDIQAGVTGKAQSDGGEAVSCLDSNGNTVCQVYSINIKNTGSTPVNVRGALTFDNDGATNLQWKVMDDVDTVTFTDANSDSKDDTALNTDGTIVESENLVATNGEKTYHVVVWLREIGDSQDDPDAGKTFSGSVTFTGIGADGNTSGLTASFQ